jgi:hypothetical protein
MILGNNLHGTHHHVPLPIYGSPSSSSYHISLFFSISLSILHKALLPLLIPAAVARGSQILLPPTLPGGHPSSNSPSVRYRSTTREEQGSAARARRTEAATRSSRGGAPPREVSSSSALDNRPPIAWPAQRWRTQSGGHGRLRGCKRGSRRWGHVRRGSRRWGRVNGGEAQRRGRALGGEAGGKQSSRGGGRPAVVVLMAEAGITPDFPLVPTKTFLF